MNEKYMPADGEPMSMGEFTLGEGYGSKEMYRDYPDLRPGSRVSFEKDGVVHTDTVESIRQQWGPPRVKRSVWQRLVRALTPRRWRKPLPSRTGPSITITVGTGVDPVERAKALNDKTHAAMQAIMNPHGMR